MRLFLWFWQEGFLWGCLSICSMPCYEPKNSSFRSGKRSLLGTGVHMSDFLFLAVLFAFFAMATGFVFGLEKL